jgi:hypothetical protein
MIHWVIKAKNTWHKAFRRHNMFIRIQKWPFKHVKKLKVGGSRKYLGSAILDTVFLTTNGGLVYSSEHGAIYFPNVVAGNIPDGGLAVCLRHADKNIFLGRGEISLRTSRENFVLTDMVSGTSNTIDIRELLGEYPDFRHIFSEGVDYFRDEDIVETDGDINAIRRIFGKHWDIRFVSAKNSRPLKALIPMHRPGEREVAWRDQSIFGNAVLFSGQSLDLSEHLAPRLGKKLT